MTDCTKPYWPRSGERGLSAGPNAEFSLDEDRAAVDLGCLEVRIDFCLDHREIAGALERAIDLLDRADLRAPCRVAVPDQLAVHSAEPPVMNADFRGFAAPESDRKLLDFNLD